MYFAKSDVFPAIVVVLVFYALIDCRILDAESGIKQSLAVNLLSAVEMLLVDFANEAWPHLPI
jgi:hypothetical protein